MRRPLLAAIVAFSALCVTKSARADEGSGFDLGLRLGFGLPIGNAVEDTSLGDMVDNQIPIQLDVGYRFTQNISAGAWVSYGFASTHDCPDGADCSAHDVRLGLQGQYKLMPGQFVDPWLGVGIGLEWLTQRASVSVFGQSVEGSVTLDGVEFLDLQGGADFQVTDSLAVGPFLSLSFGQFNSGSGSCATSLTSVCASGSGDIAHKALHEWLTLGVRGTYGL